MRLITISHRWCVMKKIYASEDGTLRFTHNGAIIARVNVPEHARRLAAAWNAFLEAETTAIEAIAREQAAPRLKAMQ
jgi:hypothetical protein